jgi:hypothetical protein
MSDASWTLVGSEAPRGKLRGAFKEGCAGTSIVPVTSEALRGELTGAFALSLEGAQVQVRSARKGFCMPPHKPVLTELRFRAILIKTIINKKIGFGGLDIGSMQDPENPIKKEKRREKWN